VGDCHYYSIIDKWTKLQEYGLRILEECPTLVHKVHYESILQDKANVVKGIYVFIGERRFGGVKRQASVLYMKPTDILINGAMNGNEAQKAKTLSSQFQNLGRGPSFAATQTKKWLHPETGLKEDEIQLIESVAHETMGKLGYTTHLVGITSKADIFTEEQLRTFDKLNKQGIQKMNNDLQRDNPGDYERRIHQSEALQFKPILLEDWSECDFCMTDDSAKELYGTHYLSEDYLKERLAIHPARVAHLTGQRCLRWATASQRGYYPNDPNKPNQDASIVQAHIVKGRAGRHWFSVFDGHGPDGHKCSEFVRKHLHELCFSKLDGGTDTNSAIVDSHLTLHDQMLQEPDIDVSLSGTTAVTLCLENDKCFVSNVGDSTCIMGSHNGLILAKKLCTEQTPLRTDERDRIKRAGGIIMTVDQRDGLAPLNESWDKNEAPPRIWSSDNEKFPGCGFTRSIGDSIAHSLGVIARPEIFEYSISKNDHILIVASDGISQCKLIYVPCILTIKMHLLTVSCHLSTVMSSSTCIEIACNYENPSEAAAALVAESTKRWIARGDYVDDITVIVILVAEDNKETCNVDLEAGTTSATVVEFEAQEAMDFLATFWTLLAGASSGFLGGLCGIPGPPIILYFLHPPVIFTKKSQHATGVCISATNVATRVVYYLVETLFFDGQSFFEASDWGLYLSVFVCSILGALIGSTLFKHMKGSQSTMISGILAIFLLLCGVSLLLSSFAGV
jgi:serine/threonine protein phosphatase PrpC